MNNFVCIGDCEYPEGLIDERALCKCLCHSQPKEIQVPETESLRDKFAMNALNGLLANSFKEITKQYGINEAKRMYLSLADMSYVIADYMLERRKKDEQK
jgi:hypothetical protein